MECCIQTVLLVFLKHRQIVLWPQSGPLCGGHKADHYSTAHSTFQMKISYCFVQSSFSLVKLIQC